jgi:hypothetical protein
MKTTEMKVIRIIFIGILGVIAFILAIGEPSNDESWFFTFFLSKGIAIIIGYVAYKLFVIWDAKGLLPDYHLEEYE